MPTTAAPFRIAASAALGIALGARAAAPPPRATACGMDTALVAEASFRAALVYDRNKNIIDYLKTDPARPVPEHRVGVYIDSIQSLTDFPAHESRKFFLEIDSTAEVQWVVFRGTVQTRDWLVDGDERMIKDPRLGIMVHRGFQAAADSLYRKISVRLHPSFPLYVAGHSLGGAMAVLAAAYLSIPDSSNRLLKQCITFGQPKVTNGRGLEVLRNRIRLTRVINRYDPVPRVPPADGYQLATFGIDKYDAKLKHYAKEPASCDGFLPCAWLWLKAPVLWGVSLFDSDSTTHYFHFGPSIHVHPAMLSDTSTHPECWEGESPDDWKNVNIIWSGGDHTMLRYDSIVCKLAGIRQRYASPAGAPLEWALPPPPEVLAMPRDAYAVSEDNTLQGRYRIALHSLAVDSAGNRKPLAEPVEIGSQGIRKAVGIDPAEVVGDGGYMRLSWERLDKATTPMAAGGTEIVRPRPSHALQFWFGPSPYMRNWSSLPRSHFEMDLYAGSRWFKALAASVEVRWLSYSAENDLHQVVFPSPDAANPFPHGEAFRTELSSDFLWPEHAFLPGLTAGLGFQSAPEGNDRVEMEPRVFLGAAVPRLFFPEEWLHYRAAIAYDKLWDFPGSTPWRIDLAAQANIPWNRLIYPNVRIDCGLPLDLDVGNRPAEFRISLLLGMDVNALAQAFHTR